MLDSFVIRSLAVLLGVVQFLSLLTSANDASGAEWKNTEQTTLLWQLISDQRNENLHELALTAPQFFNLRSEDGRGALWWAFEYGNADALAIMELAGVDLQDSRQDASGKSPKQLAQNLDELMKAVNALRESKKVERTKIIEMLEERKKQYQDSAMDDGDEFEDELDDLESDTMDNDDLDDMADEDDDLMGGDFSDDDQFRDEL